MFKAERNKGEIKDAPVPVLNTRQIHKYPASAAEINQRMEINHLTFPYQTEIHSNPRER